MPRDEETQKQMAKIRDEMAELHKDEPVKLKEHLELFNDAVIAIIITIMVLEIPLPGEHSYQEFLRATFVFMISFFIVANFWYDHHRTFSLIKKADRPVLVVNFLFLAMLSLIPIMTKWVMQEHSRLAILNYGIVYFFIHLTEVILYRIAYKEMFGKSQLTLHFSNRMVIIRIWSLFGLNIFLILLSWKIPSAAMLFYLVLPILSFLFPDEIRQHNKNSGPPHGGRPNNPKNAEKKS